MSDLNRWTGAGRLTRDAELRYTQGGSAVADIGLASNRIWMKNGEKVEEVLFLDIAVWGKQAEALSPYLTKGTFVIVEGRLKLDTWENGEGAKRSKLSVVADKIYLTPRNSGSKKEEELVNAGVSSNEDDGDTPF